jgi:tetrahydromethanopterin S-methyltransferase subunit A
VKTETATTKTDEAMAEALSFLSESVGAKKCRSCGCFHNFLKAIDINFPESQRPIGFDALVRTGLERLSDVRYDCLGCEVCYPPTVLNTLEQAGIIEVLESGACFTEKVQEREGWPPLPGSYKVLRYHASVAVCTLTDEKLLSSLAQSAGPEIALIGSLQTENIGIERLVQNILANPNIRFLVVCGADSRKSVGHLPGQSLVALAHRGMDENNRIIDAPGKRPMLHNLSREAVEHFRKTVEVVDLIGNTEPAFILDAAIERAARNPGPGKPFASKQAIKPVTGYIPKRMTPDPSGYFVIHVDRPKGLVWLEHYRNEGVLDSVIQGSHAAELYVPAIDKGLVSRLDHAAYLGRELARAEQSLISGEPYVQDGAPEQEILPVVAVPECGPTCSCKRSI